MSKDIWIIKIVVGGWVLASSGWDQICCSIPTVPRMPHRVTGRKSVKALGPDLRPHILARFLWAIQ